MSHWKTEYLSKIKGLRSLEPIFESQFEPNSFGFRPNKSAHDAVDEIVKYLNYGCEHVIDADISQCFDNIDKHRLMGQVEKRISDGTLLHLIRQFIDTGIMEDSEIHSQDRGIPQGSPLSLLLANIYLDQLDKQWKASGLQNRYGENAHLIRYADDYLVIMSGNPAMVKKKLDEIMDSMDLTMNTEKTRIVKAEDGFDFLGFHFVRHYARRRGKLTTRWFPSERSKWRIRERIRDLTNRRNLSIATPEEIREVLIPILTEWGNYFAHSTVSQEIHNVWNYAQNRLMYMYCRQHNIPRRWRYEDIEKNGFSLANYLPTMLWAKRHNTMS